MKRRIIALGLAVIMGITIMGCGEEANTVSELTEKTEEVADSGSTDEMNAGADIVEADGTGTDLTKTDDVNVVETDLSDENDAEDNITEEESGEGEAADTGEDAPVLSEAVEFVQDMKIGWNLGNTFDANSEQNKQNELEFESYWCGVVTTKEMVDAIKAAGFQTIRIPVSWHNHVTRETDGSYTISEVWLNRVQEVVDYAIDNDMHVIMNIHHDNSTDYFYPSQEYMEQSLSYITSIWTQVAGRFADYDEHLIMEGMNEPRLVGTTNEWWLDLNKQQCVEAVQCINELNQAFVDTVRASGGHNKERYLLVTGYAASLDGVTNKYFAIPQDIEGNEQKIMVEVHAYIPYHFALEAESESGSTDQWSSANLSDTSEIDRMMDKLYRKYVQNGIAVVIDEFGARDKGGNIEVRTDFAAYYVEAARKRGITCCWWDNNSFTGNGENFGIFRRSDCEFVYPELVEGMMKACE